MVELNDAVKKILKNNMWYIGTCGYEPNIVPVGFKEVTDDGKLIVGVLHLKNTISNINKNNVVTVSAYNGNISSVNIINRYIKFYSDGAYGVIGYNLTGTAKFIQDGPYVEKWKAVAEKMLKGTIPVIGVLEITPENVERALPDEI